MDNERWLTDLATSVSDGGQVDWPKVESEAQDDSERELIRSFRAISEIAGAHRSWQETGGGVSDPAVRKILKKWEHLEILEKVGKGSFGEVYRAHDPQLDRMVALKLLSGGAAASLEEGKLLARVRHPNVATVYGADLQEGCVGLWMEFLEGRTLSELLREQGTFGAREATLIVVDLCRALAAVHACGILHRDVKAQNVMRETGGRIVLMDFGIGRDLQSETQPESSLSGTPLYLAPEILEGEDTSVRSDLYSLGVLLYHLVTGSFPVRGQSLDDLRQAHRRGEAALLRDVRPDLPEGFVRIVERALERSTVHRYASAGALEQALTGWLHSDEGPPVPPPSIKRLFRSPLSIAAAATLLVVLAFFAIRSFRNTEVTAERGVGILVADFDNRTGDPLFDSAIHHLFTLALSQSPSLEVLSHEQIFDTLNRMKKPASSRLDLETSREICLRENLGTFITGEIARSGAGTSITVSAVDARSGGVREMLTIFLAKPEDLVSQIDQAAAELRHLFGESRASIEQNYQSLERVTTPSLKALSRFTQALDLHAEGKIELAIEALKTAVQIDPQFATAYSRLSIYQGGVGNYAAAFEAAERAFQLRDRVSERERHRIAGTYHLDRLQYENALREFQQAVILDPGDSDSYRQIALLHANLGEASAGIEPARKARDLLPQSVINEGVLILLLAQAQRPDEALRELGMARERFGSDPYLSWGEGVTRVMKGDLGGAVTAFEALAEGETTYASHGRILLAQTLMMEGKLRAAIAQLEMGLALDARKGFERNGAIRCFFLAKAYALSGERNEAMRHLDAIEDLNVHPMYLKVFRNAALLAVEIRDFDRAGRLLSHIEELQRRYPNDLGRGAASQIRGEIQRSQGKLEEARASLEEARLSWDDPSTLRSLAIFWTEQGECDKARRLLDQIFAARGRGIGDFFAPWVDVQDVRRSVGGCRQDR